MAAPCLALTELLLEEIGLNLALDLLTVHQPSLSTTLPCLVLLIATFYIFNMTIEDIEKSECTNLPRLRLRSSTLR